MPRLPAVVDFAWVEQHRGEVVLADVRWYLDGRSGFDAYRAGHLPGALYVDLDRWLAAPASTAGGRHPLPDPSVFAEAMAGLGIGDDSVVVGYDDAGGVIAARLVWMLRATGHDAALLDGGMLAYDGALSTEEPQPAPAHFTARPWPAERLTDVDGACDPGAVVIDARQRERYEGAPDGLDPRAGHIPGARSVPCREHLDERGRFLPVDELRRHFEAAGVRPGARTVSYCGSGVTACHNLLAMEHAGLGEGVLFPGSWSQYSRTDRPAETGPDPHAS